MTLMPKKIKYRKVQRGRMGGISKGAREFLYGDFALQAVEPQWVTAQQIEAMRVTLSRAFRKMGKFYLRVFPYKPVTAKPAETRMGKGKGNVDRWVAVVKRERILCEVSGVDVAVAQEVLKRVSYKLPLKTKFIKRSDSDAKVSSAAQNVKANQ